MKTLVLIITDHTIQSKLNSLSRIASTPEVDVLYKTPRSITRGVRADVIVIPERMADDKRIAIEVLPAIKEGGHIIWV